MIKLWRFLSISIIVAVCLGLVSAAGAPPQVTLADGNSGIEVQPDTVTVGFSENFSVDIWANVPSTQSWDTADAHLNFSPTYLEVVSITDDALPNVLWSKFDNTNGTIDYTAGSLLTPVTGSLLVCTINFTSKSTGGVSTLEFVDIAPLRITDIIYAGTRLINWSMVVNGTVQVGVPPGISVSPHKLIFSAVEGGEKPPDQMLEACNTGNGTLSWSLSDTAGWLSETPVSGSLGEGECEDVTVSVDVTGMEAGDYSGTITITGSAVVEIPVSLHIEPATVPIPGGPANLSASSLSISPQQVKPGEEVTISVNVANTGGETDSYNAILYINGAVEDSQTVSVAGGTSENVIFTVTRSQAGVYDVSLVGQSGQFEVVGGGFFGGGLGTGGIIAIVVIVIAVIVALFFILRGTRRET